LKISGVLASCFRISSFRDSHLKFVVKCNTSWFALEGVCKDFRNFSGLAPKESLEVLIVVLTNMLAEQKAELEKLNAEPPPQ
jgi:hypothetical protein